MTFLVAIFTLIGWANDGNATCIKDFEKTNRKCTVWDANGEKVTESDFQELKLLLSDEVTIWDDLYKLALTLTAQNKKLAEMSRKKCNYLHTLCEIAEAAKEKAEKRANKILTRMANDVMVPDSPPRVDRRLVGVE